MDVNALITEVRNLGLFLEAVLLVMVYTGSIIALLIALGYELQTKRRTP